MHLPAAPFIRSIHPARRTNPILRRFRQSISDSANAIHSNRIDAARLLPDGHIHHTRRVRRGGRSTVRRIGTEITPGVLVLVVGHLAHLRGSDRNRPNNTDSPSADIMSAFQL